MVYGDDHRLVTGESLRRERMRLGKEQSSNCRENDDRYRRQLDDIRREKR